MRGGDASVGLRYAGLRRDELRLSDLDAAASLIEFFLVGSQGAGSGVSIRFRGVVLLLGDFALVEQWFVAREIGLRELGIGLALVNVGLRPSKIGSLGLLVGHLRAREVGFGACQLCIRARSSARHVFTSARNVHTGRLRVRFRQSQFTLGLVEFGLIVARIDAHQHLAGLNLLVVIDQDFGHTAVDLGRYRRDVTVDLRVVGALAIVVVEIERRKDDHQSHARDQHNTAQLGIGEPLWRLLQRQTLFRQGLNPCRIL